MILMIDEEIGRCGYNMTETTCKSMVKGSLRS
jgi:hypothetical protein